MKEKVFFFFFNFFYKESVNLKSVYFAENENSLLKILLIKVKVNWNSIIRPINSIKKYNKTHKK